jgi:hypothetical protein
VKPPRSQFTLSELMGLVALCGVGFALLTTSMLLLGIGVLVVVPGFVLGRVRGGTGIIGGTISGCVLPAFISFPAALIELHLKRSPLSEYLNLFPALYLLFVLCLVWSGILSSILYLVDRRLQGHPRSHRPAPGPVDQGIWFLPDDDRTERAVGSRSQSVASRPTSRRGPDR